MFKTPELSFWGILICAAIFTSGCDDNNNNHHDNNTLDDAGNVTDAGKVNGDASHRDATNTDSDSGKNADTSPPSDHQLKYSKQLLDEPNFIADLQPFIFEDTLHFALNVESL